MKAVMRFLRNEEGATAVEYGIMVGLIAAVIIATVVIVGNKTNNAFDYTEGQMSGSPFTGS